MKKIIPLSLLAVASIYANELELDVINVESTTLNEVAQNTKTSADVASALSNNIPSIDISRRSGIANDILIRGQKRDNIAVEVDGTKIYGACPNRMDPPISHILANQIESIEVTEGPYDVTRFGVMSGGVNITTKQPTQKAKSEVNIGFGSFGYKKFGATGSGGNDFVRVSITASTESSEQYRDGDGHTLAEQIDNYAGTNSALQGVKLKSKYHNMPAYEKKSAMIKAFVTTTKDQELRLSYTANRSENILYANSKMDALWDNSNIYSISYNVKNINSIYKNVNLQYYKSDVDHPMATSYRLSSDTTTMDNTNQLTTDMQGIKLQNRLLLDAHTILFGLDASQREWDGRYYNTSTNLPLSAGNSKSIDDVQTRNFAIFSKLDKAYGDLKVSVGARYDSTKITHATLHSNEYKAFNANIFTTYNLNEENKFFFGLGQASRVPDARELYFTNSKGGLSGTPNLKQTKNSEMDLGYESDNEYFKFKLKLFFSQLENYIYIQKGVTTNAFSNIDATLYGSELSLSYYIGDDMTLDLSASYKRGQKDTALTAQTDKDLADIAPLRGSVALNYEYMNNSMATLELKASDKWNHYDVDNGEQELDSWSVINMKVKHALNKKFDFTLGVNNLFNKAYTQSNSYVDLTLIVSGTDDVMLMNEPGRYIYSNLDFKF